jgi:hypothetical protein
VLWEKAERQKVARWLSYMNFQIIVSN